MKVLSLNHNGAVKSTSNKGFQVKREANTIARKLAKLGATVDKAEAKTGTIYLGVELDNIFFEVRVSNHTKRGYESDDMELLSYFNKVTWIDGKRTVHQDSFELDYVNIIDTESKAKFVSLLDSGNLDFLRK